MITSKFLERLKINNCHNNYLKKVIFLDKSSVPHDVAKSVPIPIGLSLDAADPPGVPRTKKSQEHRTCTTLVTIVSKSARCGAAEQERAFDAIPAVDVAHSTAPMTSAPSGRKPRPRRGTGGSGSPRVGCHAVRGLVCGARRGGQAAPAHLPPLSPLPQAPPPELFIAEAFLLLAPHRTDSNRSSFGLGGSIGRVRLVFGGAFG